MKKVLRNFVASSAMILAVSALAGCGSVKGAVYEPGTAVKVGLITLHDESSTYDKNFIDAMNQAVQALGSAKVSQLIVKSGVDEDEGCLKACKDLVKAGCNFVFADSFGHQDYMLEAAKKWPSVTFCHATGVNAKGSGLANYHNAFASIYEGRYLAGVAAGKKLEAMAEAGTITAKNKDANGNIKLGYIGAFTYAEVVSGYSSWYLGVKSVVPNVVMDVTFTGSWYDVGLESAGAQTLIDSGAALISQHADSMGAPSTCETAGVPNVTYNVSTEAECPNTYVAMSRINWAPYFTEVINSMYEDRAITGETNNNWTGTLATGSVEYGVKDAAVASYVATVEAELKAGTRKVFDTSKFTVGGKTLDEKVVDNVNVIKTENGITYFDESTVMSAPYFDEAIDGITLLNQKF